MRKLTGRKALLLSAALVALVIIPGSYLTLGGPRSSLLPVKLAPGEEEEYSSTYLVRGDLPEGQRQLFVTYELDVTGS
ncbi:MAG: hypothetical protein HYV04_21065 [Deltaproteobacteria bacterium]|nr:hypothetical protein [Deltaproteobacteria bacterium]